MASRGRSSGRVGAARKRPGRAGGKAKPIPVPVEAVPDDVGRLGRLARHPLARYLLLAPTALSALANIESIGSLAHRLVDVWRPTLHALATALDVVTPDWIPGSLAVTILFFLPFPLLRLWAVVRGRDRETPVWAALLGLASFFVLFVILDGDPEPEDIGVSAGYVGIIALTYFAVRSVFHFVRRLRGWTVLALPLASSLTVGTMALWATLGGVGHVIQSLTLVLLVSLSLLHPQRLTQVATLALGVIGISLAYDWLGGLGG